MPPDRLLICRAHFSAECYAGDAVDKWYEPPDFERDDATYDPASRSVICNACYWEMMPLTRSGVGLLHELGEVLRERDAPPPDARPWWKRMLRIRRAR